MSALTSVANLRADASATSAATATAAPQAAAAATGPANPVTSVAGATTPTGTAGASQALAGAASTTTTTTTATDGSTKQTTTEKQAEAYNAPALELPEEPTTQDVLVSITRAMAAPGVNETSIKTLQEMQSQLWQAQQAMIQVVVDGMLQ